MARELDIRVRTIDLMDPGPNSTNLWVRFRHRPGLWHLRRWTVQTPLFLVSFDRSRVPVHRR